MDDMKQIEGEIQERFAIGDDGILRWKAVSTDGLPRWAVRAARRLNLMVGKEVKPKRSGCINLYGNAISVGRVKAVVKGMPYTVGDKGQAQKKSGLPIGITWVRNRFVARIKHGRRLIHVGTFRSVEDAVAARSAMVEEMFFPTEGVKT